jgi:hypothetical protein
VLNSKLKIILQVDPLQQTMGVVTPRVSSLSDFPVTTGSFGDTYAVANYSKNFRTAANIGRTSATHERSSNDISLLTLPLPFVIAVVGINLFI